MAVEKDTGPIVKKLLARFDIPETDYHFEPLTQGLINDTFLISQGTIPRYILQRINHEVFPNVRGLMGNIQNALTQLRSDRYTQIALVPTKEGAAFLEDPVHGFWRVMSYIPNSIAYNTTNDPSIAREAGRIIAEFHSLLVHSDPSEYVDTIPHFHDLAHRKIQFLDALAVAKEKRIHLAKEAIAFAHKTLEKLSPISFEKLPLRVCHNDTKLNNLLFSQKTHKALCLIDLDTLMKGYFLYDFGDAVRIIANPGGEDAPDLAKITFKRPLFEAFIDGLALNGAFLHQNELETLAVGAFLMPFIHGLRALTDYLNNDQYYKVTYELQNLDRCQRLFRFTEKALQEEAYMRKMIVEKLIPID